MSRRHVEAKTITLPSDAKYLNYQSITEGQYSLEITVFALFIQGLAIASGPVFAPFQSEHQFISTRLTPEESTSQVGHLRMMESAD
jgi:hypothetical protein